MSVFLDLPEERILFRGEFFFIIKDSFAVSPGHMLIVSNMLRLDYFALTSEEKADLAYMIERAKELIESEYEPDGFNIGMNCGVPAGQSVMHFHCHVIPRYIGDMPEPKGGVRHCVAGRGNY